MAVLAFIIVKPFIGSIVAGLFLCYVFYPVYSRLHSWVKNSTVASFIMTFCLFFVIVAPLAILAQIIVAEILSAYSRFGVDAVIAVFSAYFSPEMQALLISVAKQALGFLASLISSFVLSLPQKVINALVLVLTVFVSFRSGKKIVENLISAIPVKTSYKYEMMDRFKQTTDAIIYGVVVVSLVQGIAALVGFYIFDVPSPVICAFLTFVVAALPILGPAAIWAPIAVFKYLSGDVSSAVGLAVYGLVVQTLLLDLGLKMKIIGAKGKIPPLIVLLGVLGGVIAFGAIGLLLGPIVLVIFIELLKVYFGKNVFTC